MNVKDAINSRRAIKHFDPDHRLSAQEERELLSLAMLSPTAFNIQNWRFAVIKDPQLRRKIRAAAWDQAQVTDSSLFIVLCADLNAWEKSPERYWRNTAREVQEFMTGAIDGYYRGKPRVQRDEAMRSCGIAAQSLMLAAQEMGYGSSPMDGFDFEKVGKLINLPEDHVIAMFVAIGKPLQGPHPRSGPLSMEEAVVIDGF